MQETLDNLARREEPLVVKLERQPGQKEVRYAHLLSGEVIITNQTFEKSSSARQSENERVAKLEEDLGNLRSEFDLFRQSFEEFKKQFE